MQWNPNTQTLELREGDASGLTLATSPDAAAPLLGNGRVGVVPAPPPLAAHAKGHALGGGQVGLDARQCVLAAGDYGAHPEDTFRTLRVRLGSLDATHELSAVDPGGAALGGGRAGGWKPYGLCLRNAELTAPIDVRARTSVSAVTPTLLAHVDHRLRVMRHLPNVILHSLAITVPPEWQQGFLVQHEVTPPSPHATFSSCAIDDGGSSSSSGSGGGMYLLRGRTTLHHHQKQQHVACAYLWEEDGEEGGGTAEGAGAVADNMGFSTSRSGEGVTRFVLRKKRNNNNNNNTYRLHIITTLMSSAESPDPGAAMERLLLSLFARYGSSGSSSACGCGSGGGGGSRAAAVVAALDAAHAEAWAGLWGTTMTVVPKAGVTEEEAADVVRVNAALQYAMFTLHSTARAGGSVLDVPGASWEEGDGELWLMRALLLLQPDAARAALDARHATLPGARRGAETAGLAGARFPFTAQLSATAGPPGAPPRLFNSALVAMNAWDYFRTTYDRGWLLSTGYPLIREVADMLTSAAIESTAPADGGGGSALLRATAFTMPPAAGLDDAAVVVSDASSATGTASSVGAIRAPDNSITVASTMMTMRAATEACYELGYKPRPEWEKVRRGLEVPWQPPPAPGAVLARARTWAATENTQPTPPAAALLEPLIALQQPLSPALYGRGARPVPDLGSTIMNTLAFWRTRLPPAPASQEQQEQQEQQQPSSVLVDLHNHHLHHLHPLNQLLAAQALAQAAQVIMGAGMPQQVATQFAQALNVYLTDPNTRDPLWGTLTRPRPRPPTDSMSPPHPPLCDPSLCAMLVLVILHGLASVRVIGVLNAGRVLVETMGIAASTRAVLPHTWDRLLLWGIGHDRKDFVVVNSQLYAGYTPGGSMLTPYTVDNIR